MKESEWKGKYSTNGNQKCYTIETNKNICDYIFWEGKCLNKESLKGEIIGIKKEKLIEELDKFY